MPPHPRHTSPLDFLRVAGDRGFFRVLNDFAPFLVLDQLRTPELPNNNVEEKKLTTG